MPEMKNLTINGKTYEVMDEIARNAINNINVPSDLSTKLSSAIYKSSTPSMIAGELAVGTIVTFKVGGVDTDWIVVHQGNPNTSIYHESCNGTWLMQKDLTSVARAAGSNIYTDDPGHKYLNDTYYGIIDSRIRKGIKTVKIPYGAHQNSPTVYTLDNGLSCKLFIPASGELGYSSPRADCATLNYFSTDATNKRIATVTNSSGSSYYYTRTFTKNNYNYAIYVYAPNGSCSSGLWQSEYPMRPMMIMDSDFNFGSIPQLVDVNSNPISIESTQIVNRDPIAVGSYTGTGTGSVSLGFDFPPKIILITSRSTPTVGIISASGGVLLNANSYGEYNIYNPSMTISGTVATINCTYGYLKVGQSNVYSYTNAHTILDNNGAVYDYVAWG